MSLNPKIRKALQAIESARADLVAVLREFEPHVGASTAPADRKRRVTRRAAKAVAKKRPLRVPGMMFAVITATHRVGTARGLCT